MPEVEHYEVLVIGSGEAGKNLTWSLAQAGRRTAVVERKYIGGSCPNIACLPSKNLIRSAFRAEASEMMAAVQTAMLGGLPYTMLRDAIFTHPTSAEGLVYILASTPAKVMQQPA